MSADETHGAPPLKFDAQGLLPAVVQDAATRQVLMVGYMNREALRRTLATGRVWFWSRSRGRLWQKGETSGHSLHVRALHLDCDGDVLLVEAEPAGPTCHTGAVSCFFHALDAPARAAVLAALDADSALAEPAAPDGRVVEALFAVIQQRQRERPEGSYVVRLLDGGVDRIAKKIGEEATEVVIAAKNGAPAEITWEVADLWFHTLVLLAASGLSPADIWRELERRRR
ncbi:MAG TPA: bifunctional phosphoribosyl-AMP cyclohydrolase/phosphoribosyl-ATP diphosphatase HisIE [Chloroflexota bacterium]|jgi:phosphoribosyl-ATP pyrophosphohydrolase/phosphoribosyl-AMP cyclohydrolase|nr:bifunctional phosphoribosyl-AMP cyclohydrolase/phosphoribosyl-ATP diphosphatase HisIE [Chloroflexota bacterium]